MSFNPLEYKGNAIFRNQPNHSYFDKSYDDGSDPLFLLVNDIDPYFWQPEQRAETLNLVPVAVEDPRSQTPLKRLKYDHTKENTLNVFHANKRSILTEQQHEICVQALNRMQQGMIIEEEQLYHWYSTETARQKEKEQFQKFVTEYCQNNRDQIYLPSRQLLELYQKWYKKRSQNLMARYTQAAYNTHLGLPHINICKNVLKDLQVDMCNMEIVAHLGTQSKWNENGCKELKKLKQRMESYQEVYMNSEVIQDDLEKDLQTLFLNNRLKQDQNESHVFYVPLESLLFLLTAGDYMDIPMEMLLTIREINKESNENEKVVVMDLPLPARQAGWHTYHQVVEQAALALLSINELKKEDHHTEEYGNLLQNDTIKYKVNTFEEFIKSSKASADKLCKISKSLIKWQLKPLEDPPIHLYTSILNFPVKENEVNNSFSLKLEYKPQFGCEIMTKYELLKEWLKLKLLQKPKTSCIRLDILNYQPLLQESLTVQKLEDYLATCYQFNCQQMLNNFYEFLKMLYNMPCDHYMLRFNPKFKDKLMLCKPSKEITQNTIHLHQLLCNDITDILFMSQQVFLPIDDNLCSLMHLQHKIIPCAFSPRAEELRGEVLHRQAKKGADNKSKLMTNKAAREHSPKNKKINKSRLKRTRKRQRDFENLKAGTALNK